MSSIAARVQLEDALDFAWEGDELVANKLDRFARPVADLIAIIEILEQKAVGFGILNLGMDTKTVFRLLIDLSRL